MFIALYEVTRVTRVTRVTVKRELFALSMRLQGSQPTVVRCVLHRVFL